MESPASVNIIEGQTISKVCGYTSQTALVIHHPPSHSLINSEDVDEDNCDKKCDWEIPLGWALIKLYYYAKLMLTQLFRRGSFDE